ncbi:hypothetical protein ES695_01210 [Candidatus Atribacteria bacterium 1244-E10-H5-B2]|nr:MAG: hypothetical protein ES695_01210 [Candidatus Atribacteria bacterium 1244-E10-H5-B2]
MLPDRLNFLKRFDNFYQVMVNSVKEAKINERDFYLIIGAKVKSMNQERREKGKPTKKEGSQDYG